MTNTLATIRALWRMILNPLLLGLFFLGLMIGTIHAASLNKCTDIYGKVTYSNLACAGTAKARTVEIDPAPPVPKAAATKLKAEKAAVENDGVVKLETFSSSHKKSASKRKADKSCDTLTDKLGLVLDKMDAARRSGYTQKQMDSWNLDIKELERKKQQAGCF
jgi:hypothetical protein